MTSHSTPPPSPLALETCQAVRIKLGPLREVIVWKDGKKWLRPAEKGKRIRDLKPGDAVFYRGKPETVLSIEPWR